MCGTVTTVRLTFHADHSVTSGHVSIISASVRQAAVLRCFVNEFKENALVEELDTKTSHTMSAVDLSHGTVTNLGSEPTKHDDTYLDFSRSKKKKLLFF